jgi:hypothetical protein
MLCAAARNIDIRRGRPPAPPFTPGATPGRSKFGETQAHRPCVSTQPPFTPEAYSGPPWSRVPQRASPPRPDPHPHRVLSRFLFFDTTTRETDLFSTVRIAISTISNTFRLPAAATAHSPLDQVVQTERTIGLGTSPRKRQRRPALACTRAHCSIAFRGQCRTSYLFSFLSLS